MTQPEYVLKWYPTAERITRGTGIFPETILLMGVVESADRQGHGPESGILAYKYNNHQGIKADNSWHGKKVELGTSHDAKKRSVFRVYDQPGGSYTDVVKFLQENKRYRDAGVLESPDYITQIIRIAKAGYAEDPSYRATLVSIANKIFGGAKKFASNVSHVDAFVILSATAIFLDSLFNNSANESS